MKKIVKVGKGEVVGRGDFNEGVEKGIVFVEKRLEDDPEFRRRVGRKVIEKVVIDRLEKGYKRSLVKIEEEFKDFLNSFFLGDQEGI